jgi:hypothetical protein
LLPPHLRFQLPTQNRRIAPAAGRGRRVDADPGS